MAHLGRKAPYKFAVSLALLLVMCFGLTSQVAAQNSSDNVLVDLRERVDQILRSEGASSQIDIDRLFDDLLRVAQTSTVAIGDTSAQAETLLDQAEERLSATLSGADGTAPVCGPICREQEEQIEILGKQISSLRGIEADMIVSIRNIERNREEVLIRIQAEQFYDSIQLIQESFNELLVALEGIESEQLERLQINVPDFLDCPGPGCPLAS